MQTLEPTTTAYPPPHLLDSVRRSTAETLLVHDPGGHILRATATERAYVSRVVALQAGGGPLGGAAQAAGAARWSPLGEVATDDWPAARDLAYRLHMWASGAGSCRHFPLALGVALMLARPVVGSSLEVALQLLDQPVTRRPYGALQESLSDFMELPGTSPEVGAALEQGRQALQESTSRFDGRDLEPSSALVALRRNAYAAGFLHLDPVGLGLSSIREAAHSQLRVTIYGDGSPSVLPLWRKVAQDWVLREGRSKADVESYLID